MSNLLHEDSLMLFESLEPTSEEIIEAIEFYAGDKLAELSEINEPEDLMTHKNVVGPDEVIIDFISGSKRFYVTVVEWDRTQGVAVPLVQLYRV